MSARFRLMTTNLLHEMVDVAHFASVVEEHRPDIVVTQELGPEAADVLYSAYDNHRLRPALDFTGRGIATNFEARFGDIPMPGRDGTYAVFRIDGRPIRVAGVHLLNPINFPWWTSVRKRGLQLDGLFAWLDEGDGPVVAAGDFNASPAWPAYKKTSERLDDLVADWAGEARRPELTWAWRPGWPRMLRIDHVFGSGVIATSVSVVPIRGSDHAAVVAGLELV